MEFYEKLFEWNACRAARDWVGTKSLEESWSTCQEPSWMFWLAGKANIDRKLLVLAACDCAETALPYCSGETLKVAKTAIYVTRQWCQGLASIEEVKKSAASATAAYASAVYAGAAAAGAAAATAAYASAVYAGAAAAAAYAGAAAAAGADYASAGAAAAARKQSFIKSCQLIRERILVEFIALELK